MKLLLKSIQLLTLRGIDKAGSGHFAIYVHWLLGWRHISSLHSAAGSQDGRNSCLRTVAILIYQFLQLLVLVMFGVSNRLSGQYQLCSLLFVFAVLFALIVCDPVLFLYLLFIFFSFGRRRSNFCHQNVGYQTFTYNVFRTIFASLPRTFLVPRNMNSLLTPSDNPGN